MHENNPLEFGSTAFNNSWISSNTITISIITTYFVKLMKVNNLLMNYQHFLINNVYLSSQRRFKFQRRSLTFLIRNFKIFIKTDFTFIKNLPSENF